MNDFKKAVSDAQAQKAEAERNKERITAEQKEKLQKWLADVLAWEKAVYNPTLKDAEDALKDIGGVVRGLSTQQGTYDLTIQARGKAQRTLFKIERDGTLNIVTHGGLGAAELDNIVQPSTARRFKDELIQMVKAVAS